MQKIKQRFSLTHSTTPPPLRGGTSSPHFADSTPRTSPPSSSRQPSHRKKRSLVDGISGLLQGVKYDTSRPSRHKVLHHNKRSHAFPLTTSDTTATATHHHAKPHQPHPHHLASAKKSQSFSHGHAHLHTAKHGKAKPKMAKPKKRRRARRRSSEHKPPNTMARSQSNRDTQSDPAMSIPALPEAEIEDDAVSVDVDDFIESDDEAISPLREAIRRELSHSKSRSSMSSLPNFGRLRGAQSARSFSSARSARHSMAVGVLPRPQSPHTFVEHEKNTLIEQMRQLQSSMVQLGDMLRNQDQDLVRERKENEKLTAQVNDLADENILLRSRMSEQRHERNTLWQELQHQKQAVRERSNQNLALTDRSNKLCAQISELEAQKSELSAYSQSLLQQLTAERKQTSTLRTKIRKYSRNVRSLHKRTSSMSGLSKYKIGPLSQQSSAPATRRSQKPNTARFASRTPETPPISEVGDDHVTLMAPSPVEVVPVEPREQVEQRHNMDLQQKRLELQELERHTLDILNQLQEETKLLLGEATQKAGHRSASPSADRRSTRSASPPSAGSGEAEEKDDVVQTITTKTRTTKKTKTKTTKTTINGNVVKEEDIQHTEEKTEEVTKTKISLHGQGATQAQSDSDSDDSSDEDEFDDAEEEGRGEEMAEADVKELAREVCLLPRRASLHHKEEVAMLKKADAPLSLLFAAFEKQMQCEVDEATDSGSETPSPVPVIVPESALTPTQGGNGDEMSVASMFANFDGFSSDEEDTNEAAQSLWD